MNLIETVFGFSPDNGTGVLELLVLLIVCVVVIGILRRKAAAGSAMDDSRSELY